MKKIAMLIVLALLISGSAFAMQCESSQSGEGPEVCWTTATLSNAVTSAILAGGVSSGTVMIYDTTSGQLGQNGTLSLAATGATLVKLATVSLDGNRVAGVLQVSLDPNKVGAGSQVRLLVRGLGDLIMTGPVTSGDALMVKAAGADGGRGSAGPTTGITSAVYPVIGTALETYATATTSAKKKAIISIV